MLKKWVMIALLPWLLTGCIVLDVVEDVVDVIL